ncbi:MAG TPA: hypothetical protein VJB14_15685 [Planctomycetota bacterium]|nr:hypothetical protein [Planctomycetota bacterium]
MTEPKPIKNLWQQLETGELSDSIHFDFVKSNLFRVIHADGVWISPYGENINVTFFNERIPIPRQTTQELKNDGTLGPEDVAKRLGRDALIREMEVNVVMSLQTAKAVQAFLKSAVDLMETRLGQLKKQQKM